MEASSIVDRVKTAAEVVEIGFNIVFKWLERRDKSREVEKRIEALEAELAKLKGSQ